MTTTWKQVLYGANYLNAPDDWINFFDFADSSCNCTHVIMEVLIIGSYTNGYPFVNINNNTTFYIFPLLGSTSITWFDNIVTNVTTNYNVTNASAIFQVTQQLNTQYNTRPSSLPTYNFKLLLSFGGALSFGGNDPSNLYTTSSSNFYYGNFSTSLYNDVQAMLNIYPINNILFTSSFTPAEYNQYINSAYTFGYILYTYYLTNVNSIYPSFDGIDFDLEGFGQDITNHITIEQNNILYYGVVSMTIKYLSNNGMIVTHAPQPPYFSPYLLSNVNQGVLWPPDIYNSQLTFTQNGYSCLYNTIEYYFGSYIDWYNIQYYNQGSNYTGVYFNLPQIFICDYGENGTIGLNCSILQLSQATSTGDYIANNSSNYNTINSGGYLTYNQYNNNYSSLGMINIPLNKLVLGIANYYQVPNYVPLSSYGNTTFTDNSYNITLSEIIVGVQSITSPQTIDPQTIYSAQFYFNPQDINPWTQVGGIMVYDYAITKIR